MDLGKINELITGRIYLIRGKKVMMDRDLAKLYGVETKYFNRSVRNNMLRFPDDFVFRLTAAEALRCNFCTSNSDLNMGAEMLPSKKGRGGRRYLPFVFTEQGVAMLSGVLRGKRAIEVNIAIMRTFVQLRQIISTHKELNDRLFELEKKYDERR
jgi:hypothetical protein